MKTLIGLLALLVAAPAFAQLPSTGGELSSNRAIVLDVSGMGTAAVSVAGTYSGTVNFEVANGLTPIAVNCTPPNSTTPATSTTSTGSWVCSVAGMDQFIVRMSSYVSGTAVVRLSAAPGGGGASGGSLTFEGELNAFDGVLLDAAAGDAITDTANDALRVNIVAGSPTVTANLSATDNAVLDDIADGIAVTGTVTANLSATDNAVLDAIEVDGERTADAVETIRDNLNADCAKGDAMTLCPEGPATVGYAKDFDGAALPDAVTEGQAQYPALSLSGVTYAMLTNEDGSLQYGTATTPMVSSLAAVTTGGCTPTSSISTAAVLETEIKATAGQLYQLVITNLDATPVFARLYNDTAANTDQTDTPVQRFIVPTQGNGNGAGFVLPIVVGQTYSTAITLRVTTGAADNDTGALSANEVFVSYCYK
jgi:hypothetical protein